VYKKGHLSLTVSIERGATSREGCAGRMMDARTMRAGCAGGRRTGVRARCAWWSGLGRFGAHGCASAMHGMSLRWVVWAQMLAVLQAGCVGGRAGSVGGL
jgi:hypothetical protein